MISPPSSASDTTDRVEQTETRMLPAHERFHAHEMKTTNVYLRLVVNDEFGSIQSRSPLPLSSTSCLRARVCSPAV